LNGKLPTSNTSRCASELMYVILLRGDCFDCCAPTDRHTAAPRGGFQKAPSFMIANRLSWF
jgi:hypothetical protein